MKSRNMLAALAILAAWSAPAPAAPPAGNDAQDLVFLAPHRPLLIRLHVQLDGRSHQAAWNDFIDQIFKYLDTDGDGVLSAKEAGKTPAPQMLLSTGILANFRPPTMEILDANQDGKVTRAELADYYRNNGGGAFQIQVGTGDRSGFGIRRGPNPNPGADALNEALFKALDTDGDGKLSRRELAAAPERLLKLDANDDEALAPEELAPTPGGDAARRLALARVRAATPHDTGVFIPLPAEHRRLLARRLLQHYGSKTEDRALTQKEIGLDSATFQSLDRNRDGQLDADELSRFAAKAPDVELHVRLGRLDVGKTAVELVSSKEKAAALGAKVESPSPGRLTLEMGTAQVEFNHGSSENAVLGSSRVRELYKMQFTAADLDSNGYLDKKEADASRFFQGTFAMMDRDSDGKVFLKEMLAYLDQLESFQKLAQKSCASLVIADRGRGLFDLLDTNKDGRLGIREMRGAVKLLDKLDRDGDGCLSLSEIPRNYRLTVNLGPATVNPRGARVVVVSSRFGGDPGPLEPPARGPLWFHKMDRNRDGDVSRREFLGTDAEFRRIDTDGDGLISLEEAQRFDALMRKQEEKK